jgi:glycosyltransferase involved in cell wall biosynthesis
VVFLVWRDTRHPDGGGSEVYVEHMARWLAANGAHVTIMCAAHAHAPADENVDGVRFRRRGGWLSVYAYGLLFLLGRQGREADVVVDVHNGIPFFSPLVRRRGLRVLVHHLHREQWRIIYPGFRGSIGWWVESRVSPRLYRGVPYLTVSESTKADLARIGVDPGRVTVVHNGIDLPHPGRLVARSPTPRVCALGRLVPHKQIEHALRLVAALGPRIPDLRLDVLGDGWWRAELHAEAERLQVCDRVVFHGKVDDSTRDRLLDESWLMLAPSVKEGWGIAIMEAAAHAVPTLAYRSAGGVTESIVDGVTGVLVDDLGDLISHAERLLGDRETRLTMGKAARVRAESFGWNGNCETFAANLFDQRLP